MRNSSLSKLSVLSASRRAPSISWTANSPGSYEIGVPKSYVVSVLSYPPQVTYSITSGSLPSGMSLNTSSGQINGTPSSSGQSYSYTITATNGFISTSFSHSGNVIAFSATGGTETTSGGFKTHVFTGTNNFVISTGLIPLEILVVAGGGGGGGRHGGGGGGGGVSYHSSYTPTAKGTYTVTVGGLGGVSNPNPALERSKGSPGGFSRILSPGSVNVFFAEGGAGGGSYSSPASSGGSGGGGAGMQYMTGSSSSQSLFGVVPSGGSKYGNSGGNGNSSTEGGGGGGAGSAGSAAGTNGGNGGNGTTLIGYTVSGGGGGGAQTTGGTGGSGGGGNGGSSGGAGSAATTYGGGGGGSRSNPTTNQAGVGFQGLVVIKYAV